MDSPVVIATGVYGEDGALHLSHHENILKRIGQMFKRGTRLAITFEEDADRLTSLWAYYWAVVIPIGMDMYGYEKDEMHEVFKLEIAPRPLVDKKTGEVLTIGKSTKRMGKKEQRAFVDAAVRKLTQDGANVPPPTPQD